MGTAVLMRREGMYVNTRHSDAIFARVLTYIHSLLIEEDGRARQNISLNFPRVFVCLSYSDLFYFW